MFEATRRKGLLALQQKIMAARADPHASDDAWSKFHVHLIVQPVIGLPSYCCTCRRRKWEMVRNVRLAAEAAWRGNWFLEREHILRLRSKALERRVKRRLAQKPSTAAAAAAAPDAKDKPLLKSLRQIEEDKEQQRQQRLPLRAQVFTCLQHLLIAVERRVHENAEKELRAEVADYVKGIADQVAEEWSRLELARLEAEKDALIRFLTPTPPQQQPETELSFREGEESKEKGVAVSEIDSKSEVEEDGAPRVASSTPPKVKAMSGQSTAMRSLQELPNGPSPTPVAPTPAGAVAASGPASDDSHRNNDALLANSTVSNDSTGASNDNDDRGIGDGSSHGGAAAADCISAASSISSSTALHQDSLTHENEDFAPPMVMDAVQAEQLASLEAQLYKLRVGLGIVAPPPPPSAEELAAQAAAEADAAWHQGWDEMVARCDLLLCFRSAATHHVTASAHVPAELMLTAPDLPNPNSPKKRRSQLQPPPPPEPDAGAVLLDRLWAATPEVLDDDEANASQHQPLPKKKLEYEPGEQGVLKVRLEPFQHHDHAEEHHEDSAAGADANSVSGGSHTSSKASKKRKTKEATTEAEANSGVAAASKNDNNPDGLQSHHAELRRSTVVLTVHATSRDKITGHPLSWRVKVKHVRGGEWWVQEFASAQAAEAHKIAHPELYPSAAAGASSSHFASEENAGASVLGTVGEEDYDNEVGMWVEAHWQHRELNGDHRLLLQPPKWSRLDRKALKAQAMQAARDKALLRAQKRSDAHVQGSISPNKTKVLAAVVAATGIHAGDKDDDEEDEENEDESSLSESSSSDEEATHIRVSRMPSLTAKVNAKRAAQEVERLAAKRQARLKRGLPRRWSVPTPPMPRWLAVLPKRRTKLSGKSHGDGHGSSGAASSSHSSSGSGTGNGLIAGSIAELGPRAAASAAAWKRSKEESGTFALVYRPPSQDSAEDVKRQGLGDVEELALEEELAGHGADAHLVAEAAKHYKGRMSVEMAAAVAKATANSGDELNLNGSMDDEGGGSSKLKKARAKGALKALLRGAAWLTVATLRTKQAATERRARALLEEAVRLREQMELQENERRAMAREEERVRVLL